MKNIKRIAALTGVVLLIGLYVITFIFALQNSPQAGNYFKAAIYGTIFIPIFLYGIILVYKLVKGDDTINPNDSEDKQ